MIRTISLVLVIMTTFISPLSAQSPITQAEALTCFLMGKPFMSAKVAAMQGDKLEITSEDAGSTGTYNLFLAVSYSVAVRDKGTLFDKLANSALSFTRDWLAAHHSLSIWVVDVQSYMSATDGTRLAIVFDSKHPGELDSDDCLNTALLRHGLAICPLVPTASRVQTYNGWREPKGCEKISLAFRGAAREGSPHLSSTLRDFQGSTDGLPGHTVRHVLPGNPHGMFGVDFLAEDVGPQQSQRIHDILKDLLKDIQDQPKVRKITQVSLEDGSILYNPDTLFVKRTAILMAEVKSTMKILEDQNEVQAEYAKLFSLNPASDELPHIQSRLDDLRSKLVVHCQLLDTSLKASREWSDLLSKGTMTLSAERRLKTWDELGKNMPRWLPSTQLRKN